MLTTEVIKRTAREMGADLVGIGSMDRFEGAPPEYDPRYIFPEAKSVIGLGFRIHRGLLRGIEEGTHFGIYPSLGYANVNDVHAPVVMRELGNFIEDHGYEAVLYANIVMRYSGPGWGAPVRPGQPGPDIHLHFRIAGVICGMGEIGWSKIFLTPQFGPRQRLNFIFTDAELEPDPIREPSLCDRCMACAKHCPAQAIPRKDAETVTIAGKEFSWCKLHEGRCGLGFQVANPETNPFLHGGLGPAEPNRTLISEALQQPVTPENDAHCDALGRQMQEDFPYSRTNMKYLNHPATICGSRCMRECMIHLEQQGKLENTFHTPFRIRKPWRLTSDGQIPNGDE